MKGFPKLIVIACKIKQKKRYKCYKLVKNKELIEKKICVKQITQIFYNMKALTIF